MNAVDDAGSAQVVMRCQCFPPYDWSPIEVPDTVKDEQDEQMGSKEKFWFTDSTCSYWLFKYVRDGSSQVSGEDWAECLVHVVAQLLGIPSSCSALATCDGRRAVAVLSLLRADEELVHGNELLTNVPLGHDGQVERKCPGHTVADIKSVLDPYRAPAPYGDWAAFDLFAAYLMMDALVAGCDRHHENWGVIKHGTREGRLAPSFDHGSALGFDVPDVMVKSLLECNTRLEAWLERGRSKHFAGHPKLVEVAVEALRCSHRESRDHFLARLHDLAVDKVEEAAAAMPDHIMSEEHRTLVVRVLEVNRRRLEDAFSVGG